MPHVNLRDLDIMLRTHRQGPLPLFISGSGGDLRVRPAQDGPLKKHFDCLFCGWRGLPDESPGPTRCRRRADAAALMARRLE
jgi:hypothetical protein